jgi:hypothetical protein
LEDAFWAEPQPTIPADEEHFWEALLNGIPQFLTGLYPAAMGESDPKNETLGGIKLLGEASKGQAGVAWRAFRKAYAKAVMQLVRIGAYFRAAEVDDNSTLKLSVPRGDDIEVDLEDLRDGNWACVPDGDESYPNTHSEKRQAFKEFALLAGTTPQGQAMLFNPKNLVLIRDLNGLSDLEIPGADSEEKQMAEIKQLLAEVPIPNMETRQKLAVMTIAATAQGQPAPPKPPVEEMYQSSVQLGRFDDDDNELQTCIDWINSPQGQQAKRDNPDGYMNVELHAVLHEQRRDQKKQAAMAQQVQMLAGHGSRKERRETGEDPGRVNQLQRFGTIRKGSGWQASWIGFNRRRRRCAGRRVDGRHSSTGKTSRPDRPTLKQTTIAQIL